MNIGFLGAGNVARSLGALFVAGGKTVCLGTRNRGDNADTRSVSLEQAAAADVVVVAVPFIATRELLPRFAKSLAGKIVIDATNPVNADWSPMLLGQESSAGEEIARMLPGARVVKAFNTVFADIMRPDRLARDAGRVTCFIATDDAAAGGAVADLAAGAGFAAKPVGGLKMARHLEAMAHLNIQLAVAMNGGTNAAFVYHQLR